MFFRVTSMMRFCQVKPRQTFYLRNGSGEPIKREWIDKYIFSAFKEGDACRLPYMTRTVDAFKRAVYHDPILKMCFIGALNEINSGGVLSEYKNHPETVFRLLSAVSLIPPSFENNQLTGIPFYCLFVDFLNTRYGQAFFSNPITNFHLKRIFDDYQTMLSSKVSTKYLTQDPKNGWFGQEAQRWVNYDEYVTPKQKKLPHWGFNNWNQWFTRTFTNIQHSRPVDQTPNGIVHSSDSYPLTYPDGKSTNPTFNAQKEAQFWLKSTQYSLYDMLGAREMKIVDEVRDHFEGGCVYQAFLDPWCYHRWHAPVSGVIKYSYKLGGTYYLDNPSLSLDGTDNYVDSQPLLSTVSVRQVFIIEMDQDRKAEDRRWVGVIEIGMAEVSGCHPTVVETQEVKKGDQLGYFTFGGSSYVMIFDKKFDLKSKQENFIPSQFDIKCENPLGSKTVCMAKVNSLLCTY